ncbi:hypothetical protein Tco_1473394 [Tanacetum coccineum]
MMVQAQEEHGEGLANPTDPQHTPIIAQPSSSQPQKKHKPRNPKKKDTQIPQSSVPSDTIAEEVINEENIPTHSNDLLLSGEDKLKLEKLIALCTNLQNRVLDLEHTKTTQALEINSLKRRVNKLENKKRSRTHRLRRLYKVGLSARVISFKDEGLGQDMAKKGVSTADPVTTAGEVVTTANVEVSTASPTTAIITTIELTLAQTLAELKSARPKTKRVVMQEPSETITTTIIPSKDKGKGIMVEEPLKMKKKDQDKVETDYELAQRLQAEEQEELTIEEKSKLFQQLLEKRRKHFVAKRVKEKRNGPPTKAQQRSIMVNTFVDMDIKLVGGSEVREEGSKTREESNSKRSGDELEQEPSKKQKMEDDKETYELQSKMEVIPNEEEVAVDDIPLATKPPSIMLISFDREDLEILWKIVKAKHGYTRPEEGYERVLSGDLKTMFEHNIEDTVFRLAYRLRLPQELSSVHDTFHVSNLKKCLAHANLHVPLEEIKVDKTLRFVEEPKEIMDREVKKLKRSRIPIVKVRWNSKRGPEFTWE